MDYVEIHQYVISEAAKSAVEDIRETWRRKKMENKCGCKQVTAQGPICWDASRCPLFMLNIVCSPENCRVPDCANMAYWRQPEGCLATSVGNHPVMGRVLILDVNGKKGDCLGYYTGEVITEKEAEQRRAAALAAGDINNYFADLQQAGLLVDARSHGNKMRFVAHSCTPNVEARVVTLHDGLHVIGFFLTKNAKARELLGYDYGWVWDGVQPRTVCGCGQRHCRGYIEVGLDVPPEALIEEAFNKLANKSVQEREQVLDASFHRLRARAQGQAVPEETAWQLAECVVAFVGIYWESSYDEPRKHAVVNIRLCHAMAALALKPRAGQWPNPTDAQLLSNETSLLKTLASTTGSGVYLSSFSTTGSKVMLSASALQVWSARKRLDPAVVELWHAGRELYGQLAQKWALRRGLMTWGRELLQRYDSMQPRIQAEGAAAGGQQQPQHPPQQLQLAGAAGGGDLGALQTLPMELATALDNLIQASLKDSPAVGELEERLLDPSRFRDTAVPPFPLAPVDSVSKKKRAARRSKSPPSRKDQGQDD